MAQEARRGRPPGSKNKEEGRLRSPKPATFAKDGGWTTAGLHRHLQGVLAQEGQRARAYFRDQLAQLGGYVSKKAFAAVKASHRRRAGRQAGEAKAEISIQEEQELEVDGPRHLPTWMREEMKGTKLTKTRSDQVTCASAAAPHLKT